ncbi:MAG: stealth family protein [Propionicimonas sp.]|nr:stealth family protein [Propionicimonas sp.]
MRRTARWLAASAGLTGSSVPRIRLPRGVRPQRLTSFDAWRSLDGFAAELRAALAGAGVEVVRLERAGQILLAVPAEQRRAALAALGAADGADGWLVSGDAARARVLADPAAAGVRGDDLRVFRLLAGPGGDLVAGADLAVRLQFWSTVGRSGAHRQDGGRHAPGTRIAPVRNPVAAYLSPALWQEAQQRTDRRVRPGTPPHLLDLHEPIDIVYTWVDASDPAWQARRASVRPSGGLAADALDPARTRSHDELRYSLRSVAMYAGWVRHIWLVTDGQVPDWLAADERLTVVSHREIFADAEALPTFNSHAIEAQLHRIPGLAEHFLYLNDDVFFGRPVRPELFFHGNGIAKFAVSPIAICRDPGHPECNGAMHAARRNQRFLERVTGRTVSHRMQHIPHPHLRSSLAELERRHPDLIAGTVRSRFRSVEDVSVASDLGHYWAFANGRAVVGHLDFRYVDIASVHAPEHYDGLLADRDQDCFCLNDVGGGDAVDSEAVTTFLARYFPIPSPFERAVA